MNESDMHYYGDFVRRLFLASGVFMLVMLAFMRDFLPVSIFIAIIIAIGLCVFAGLTNPIQKSMALINFIIAMCGTALGEYLAIDGYTTYSLFHRSFWANQILAIIFLFALYFSTKTLRGMLLK